MSRDLRRDEPASPHELAALPLIEYIPRVSPKTLPPVWLKPLVDVLEKAPHGKLRVVVSVPVRHGKTTTCSHAVPWWMTREPTLEVIYATYAQRYTERISRTCRRLAIESGVKLSSDFNTIQEWHTERDGCFVATSVDGAATGMGCNVLILDDLIKGRQDAESAEIRETAHEFIKDNALTRITPDGSAFLVASRWHEDDPSGRMLKEGWDHVHLPALADEGDEGEIKGHALAPELGRTREWLIGEDGRGGIRKEVGPYGWASLYQGAPKPRGGALFRNARYYAPAHLPAILAAGAEIAIGCDLSYSAGPRSDNAAGIALAKVGSKYYVLGHMCLRGDIVAVRRGLMLLSSVYPGAPRASYVAGPERGNVDLMAEHGFEIEIMNARWNKLVRAQNTAKAWNDGDILLPLGAPWLEEFLAEVCGFDGMGTSRDDQVDALVSAFDYLDDGMALTMVGDRFTFGQRCM